MHKDHITAMWSFFFSVIQFCPFLFIIMERGRGAKAGMQNPDV